jgi:5-methylcytosine-specific restriction protein A
MQNISALLHELGIPFVRGYLPRKNVGSVKSRLVLIINDVWSRNSDFEAPTADPDAFATRLMSALEKFRAGDRPEPSGTASVPRAACATSRFVRDPEVVAWVLMRAAGRCEACGEPAPFCRGDGTPFLEVHHLRPLAEGGPDIVSNTIAACPNCHRRLHHGADRVELRRSILRRTSNLKDFPRSPMVQIIQANLWARD